MAQQGTQRRLAAILAADVVAYSRLVELDEEGTIARLKAVLKGLVDPSIERHHGRLVKTTGDGILVEFASVVDALRQAVDLQRAMAEHNVGVRDDRRIEFRIGVHLGDIIVEDDDIFGDGVNVAARLEAMAPPAGICISHAVREQIADKVEVGFEDLGEQVVKNMARPVHAFQVRLEPPEAEAAEVVDSSDEPGAASVAAVKPSIAVLPLVNMSGDPEQEFFADGISEDIITELSRFRGLFVISRTSSFAYKGKQANVQEVARGLGVQFVVEGSVRKAGNRVRITVQLIDAEADRHVWAERYDRDLEDIFAIQDEVTQSIVGTLPGRIEAVSRERAEQKPTGNMAAYEYVLTGKRLHHRSTREDNVKALSMLESAIALDPKYAHAHAWILGYSDDPDATKQQVADELEIALALDDNDSDVHRIMAALKLVYDEFDAATYHQERALLLNPNDDLIVVQQGEILTWLGEPEEGIDWIKKAMRLNPYHPERFWNHLGRAYYVAHRYGEGIEAFKRISRPDHTHHAFVAACHAQAGEDAPAEAFAARVREQQPDFSIEEYMATLHYKQADDREHHRAGLLKAGLPA